MNSYNEFEIGKQGYGQKFFGLDYGGRLSEICNLSLQDGNVSKEDVDYFIDSIENPQLKDIIKYLGISIKNRETTYKIPFDLECCIITDEFIRHGLSNWLSKLLTIYFSHSVSRITLFINNFDIEYDVVH